MCNRFCAYDIEPADRDVVYRDTIADFPGGFRVCITNPPWLAKNSATLRKLPFPTCEYDDLYKFALEKCLNNCDYVAALVPESFIRAKVFRSRLSEFVSLRAKLFRDTDHPVGLALFLPDTVPDVRVWSGVDEIGNLSALECLRPDPVNDGVRVRFNDPDGNVGLFALDNARERSIRFCDVRELANYVVKQSSRGITKIMVDGPVDIDAWNDYIEKVSR